MAGSSKRRQGTAEMAMAAKADRSRRQAAASWRWGREVQDGRLLMMATPRYYTHVMIFAQACSRLHALVITLCALVIFWGTNRQRKKEKREARFIFQDMSVGVVSFGEDVCGSKFEVFKGSGAAAIIESNTLLPPPLPSTGPLQQHSCKRMRLRPA